ncbi:hypothetical protein C8R44DRAFT_745543 [Mycena epipterygia]|nr:hypothetical protein C8R44DRAFT_745543 [Mycena epipterygia]
MSDTDTIAYTELPFYKKLKPKIQSIASAMGVDAPTSSSNQTLFYRQVKTDPPGQFARLSLKDKKRGAAPETADDEAENGSSIQLLFHLFCTQLVHPTPQENPMIKKQLSKHVPVDLPGATGCGSQEAEKPSKTRSRGVEDPEQRLMNDGGGMKER